MTTLYENYTSGGTLYNQLYGVNWRAQTFTCGATAHTVTSVKLKLNVNNDPGTVTVSIKAVDGSGHPTGADLTSHSFPATDIPGVGWFEITFDSEYTLTASTQYAIVVRTSGGDTYNDIRMYFTWTGAYADGKYEWSNDSGGTWYGTTYDFVFEVYGNAAGGATYTKALTAGTVLLKAFTKTLSGNTMLKKAFPKTFSANTPLKKTFTKTFSANTVLASGVTVGTKTWTGNTVLMKAYPKSLTANTFLQAIFRRITYVGTVLRMRQIPIQARYIAPANPLVAEYWVGENADEDEMLPGRLVVYDVYDKAVKEAPQLSDSVLGMVDVTSNKRLFTPHSRGDPVRVIMGECLVKLMLSGGSSAVAPGDALVSADKGKIMKQPTGLYGAQGSVVGYSLETRDPAENDRLCLVLFDLQREHELES